MGSTIISPDERFVANLWRSGQAEAPSGGEQIYLEPVGKMRYSETFARTFGWLGTASENPSLSVDRKPPPQLLQLASVARGPGIGTVNCVRTVPIPSSAGTPGGGLSRRITPAPLDLSSAVTHLWLVSVQSFPAWASPWCHAAPAGANVAADGPAKSIDSICLAPRSSNAWK